MDDNRIPLHIAGLTNSTVQPSSWAVILAESDGPYKIPVVIGASEAQAISIVLNGYTPPRPLTQDLILSISHAFGLQLTEVFICKFEDGIFYSQLTFVDEERTVEIDSRTSDALALAVRFRAPIYTTREVVDQTGLMIELQSSDDQEGEATFSQPKSTTREQPSQPGSGNTPHTPPVEKYTVEELEKLLEKLIAAENYEEAARVSGILNRKRGNGNNA